MDLRALGGGNEARGGQICAIIFRDGGSGGCCCCGSVGGDIDILINGGGAVVVVVWSTPPAWKSGIPESHMLDLLVCSTTLHKRIRNCHTTLDGLDSDHRAVAIELNLTSIKYKAKTSINRGDIDWRTICEEEMQRTMYNKYLLPTHLTGHVI